MVLYRFGPRQIRAESAMLRAYNSGTRAAPYESLMVADIGDVNVYEAYRTILATGCIPLTMGEEEHPFLHYAIWDVRKGILDIIANAY